MTCEIHPDCQGQGCNADPKTCGQKFYVHYFVRGRDQTREPQKCVSGPYTANEVIDARQNLLKGGGVTAAYVSEDSK